MGQECGLNHGAGAGNPCRFFLRSYLLLDQVLSDDEWHGFYYAIGKTPGWLLTHFDPGGNLAFP